MHAIRNVYKMIYRSGKTLEEVLPEIEQIAQTESAISFFVEFFKRSTRGIYSLITFLFSLRENDE